MLSEAENRLLEKGLLFVPTIKYFPIDEILTAKNKICRNLKIKDFFKDSNKMNYSNEKKLQNKSTWQPPTSKITEETIQTVSNLTAKQQNYYRLYQGLVKDLDTSRQN